jgi:RimJ/RimL family protein N-acetyltransferase
MTNFTNLARALVGVETPRLTLRAALPVDGWDLYDATQHESFNRFLSWSKPSDPYQAVARMEAISRAHQLGEICALSAIHRETDRWVALFRFLPYRPDPGIVEASLWVHSDFHHDSIGWELTRALVDKAFEVTAMPLMLAASCQENRPAQRLLLSCGFTYHSIVPRPHEEGFPLPLFEYRQTHDEWLRTMETRVTELKPTASRVQDGARTPEAANRAAFKAVAGR